MPKLTGGRCFWWRLQELLEARGRRDVANIIDAGVEVLREKIGKLRRALLDGVIEVRWSSQQLPDVLQPLLLVARLPSFVALHT